MTDNDTAQLASQLADWAETSQELHAQDVFFGIGEHDASPVDLDAVRGGSPVKRCVAGQLAVLLAPPGTQYSHCGDLLFPDGTREGLFTWAEEVLGTAPGVAGLLVFTTNELAVRRLRYLAAYPEATGETLAREVPPEGFES